MRFLLASIIAIAAVAVFVFARTPQTTPGVPFPSVIPTATVTLQTPRQSVDVKQDGRLYRIAWMTADPSEMTLIPNFSQKRTARSFIENQECEAVINGGFYTKDNKPTGLFVAGGETISKYVPNALLNGLFVVDTNDTVRVHTTATTDSIRIGLQSGPVLMQNGNAMKLAIRDDEFARRGVVAVDGQGSVVFLVVYDPANPYEGPTLADTPGILADVQTRLNLVDVINLDGGSASAFISEDLSLQELTSVGSFFCIK